MKVQIVRDTVAGKKSVFVGDVLDLPEQEARELIAMNKAQAFTEPKKPVVEEVIETADLKPAEIESTVKRGKRKE